MSCACGSQIEFSSCCELFISGAKHAPTAEALMRSRYTAYTMARVPYMRETMAPETRKDFDEANVRQWSTGSEWRGLDVIRSEENGNEATVEFVAHYKTADKVIDHHEIAQFRRDPDDNRWYFVDGKTQGPEGDEEQAPLVPFVRDSPKVGRNDPCPCGSGMKFKKCCGR